MTPGQASHSQPSAADHAMAGYRLQRVLRARGVKPATRRQERRNEQLVGANQQRDRSTRKSEDPSSRYNDGITASRHASSSPRNSAKVASYALGRARTTRSQAGCRPCTSRRHTSRNRRRTRLRATADDWNRGTISPIRGWPVSFSAQMTSRCSVRWRFPSVRHRRMSELRASRLARSRCSLPVRNPRASTEGKRSTVSGPSCAAATAPRGPTGSPCGPENHAC